MRVHLWLPVLIFVLAFLSFGIGPAVTADSKTGSANGTKTAASYVPVLLYHHFDPKLSEYNTVKPDVFEQQIAYLHRKGYRSITVSELEHFLQTGKGLPAKPVLITFDDGYESNYTYAFPILRKYGMKATVFLIVERMGKKVNGLSRLSWDEAKEMYESGLVDFQSHSYNLHNKVKVDNVPTPATLVSRKKADGQMETKVEYLARVKADFLESKQLIEQHLGNTVTSFCYPYGAYNDDLIQVVREAGFTTAFTTQEGVNTPHESPFELQRINVSGSYRGKNIENAIGRARKNDAFLPEQHSG